MTNSFTSRVNEYFLTWTRVAQLLWASSPGLTLSVVAIMVLEIFASLGSLYLMKLLVDAVSLHLASASAATSEKVFFILAGVGGFLVLTVLLQNIASMLRMQHNLRISEHVDQKIHDRAIAVDLQYYESPLYYDQLERARQGGAQRPAAVVSNILLSAKAATILLIVLILIWSIDWRLVPTLLVPVSIALIAKLYYTRRLFDWRTARAQTERRASYLDWMLTSAAHAKEMRLNHIGTFFRDQYQELRTSLRGGQMSIERARLWTEVVISVIGAVVFFGASAWLLQQSLSEQRPLGDAVLFVLLLRRAQSGGSELVSNATRLVDDGLYLKNLFEFLSIKPQIAAPASPKALPSVISEGVHLSDVSFKYAGSDDYALRGVNLHIRPGQIVALVGENGSGKTTLIKLLTRLYDPTEGAVTLDGEDVRKFEPEDYRRLFSVIFQDYALYAATAGDNIRYGDISAPHGECRIKTAAKRAGADQLIEHLPMSYDTPLTKLFDNGRDLSIGQWQRLALARSFYPPSRFVILDEPTSAVDPKAEFELFEGFRDRIGGRGALIISHRLSTIRLADYTYVLEGGRIAEHGRHDDLVLAHGIYADLFSKQARHYRP